MKLYQAPVLVAFGLTLYPAAPVLAQIDKTPVGAINVTIDGAAYAGETLAMPSEGTSTAEFRSFGPVTSISMQGHDPHTESIMRNILSIEVSLMGDNASATIMDSSSVSWWPEGMGEPFYHSEGSTNTIDLVLETLSLEDGAATIKGKISAQICRKDSMFAEADMSDCLPVEGTFDTALRKAD